MYSCSAFRSFSRFAFRSNICFVFLVVLRVVFRFLAKIATGILGRMWKLLDGVGAKRISSSSPSFLPLLNYVLDCSFLEFVVGEVKV